MSYFDKIVIFLLPIIVLQLFSDRSVYLSIEYIYSIVIVIVPFLDLGLGGYFFYAYRNNDNNNNNKKVVVEILKVFHILYISIFIIGIGLISFHYFVYSFENQIIFIVSRSIFILTFTFLTSYYRLTNKPRKSLWVTISANAISLVFMLVYFFSGLEFNLWLVFIGQILFIVFYFFKTIKRVLTKWIISYKPLAVIDVFKLAISYSWPTIIQVFILMYVANYGKINAIKNLSIDEGVLLSLVQRGSMLIQLTHAAIIGYLMKELFVSGELLVINKKIFLKYIGLLLTSVAMVVLIVVGVIMHSGSNFEFNFVFKIVSLIIGFTFSWCVFSYFEIYYSRENKNIIKLYLALINGVSFILIFNFLKMGYLERITLSMFASTLLTLITSLIILNNRGYKLS